MGTLNPPHLQGLSGGDSPEGEQCQRPRTMPNPQNQNRETRGFNPTQAQAQTEGSTQKTAKNPAT